MDATGRQDAMPASFVADFERALADRDAINAELLRRLGQRTRLLILLALAMLMED